MSLRAKMKEKRAPDPNVAAAIVALMYEASPVHVDVENPEFKIKVAILSMLPDNEFEKFCEDIDRSKRVMVN